MSVNAILVNRRRCDQSLGKEEQTLVDGQWPLMSGQTLVSAQQLATPAEEDLRAISRQLDRGTRCSVFWAQAALVILLSLEIASRVSRSRPSHTATKRARIADDIVTRVPQDLELALIEGVAGDELALALSQRQNMLVVIDNVEQVAQPMKALLARWTAAPQVTFLLTSRVRIIRKRGLTLFLLYTDRRDVLVHGERSR